MIIRGQSTHFLWLIILSVGHDLITHLQAAHVRHASLIHVRVLALELLLLLLEIVLSWKILGSSWDLAHVDGQSHTGHLLLLLNEQHLLLHQL